MLSLMILISKLKSVNGCMFVYCPETFLAVGPQHLGRDSTRSKYVLHGTREHG